MVASFLIAAMQVWSLFGMPPESRQINQTLYTWITSGDFSLDLAFRLDALSAVMILVITGIGSLIHLYSTAYMHEETDPEYARYFSYLNLFVFFMLLLVLGSNVLVMFVGWEGVGLCSYLLIGYYYEKKSASDAAKKAFIVNRVGDYAFILGSLLLVVTVGSLDFATIAQAVKTMPPEASFGMLSLITLLLFIGATGKSAQIPLYVWLPDAMEGPTPVSALIHAATMVTAGVYMIGRNAVLFEHAPITLEHRRGDRRGHGAVGGHDRPGAERHQARAGVLHGVAAGLHVPGDGRRRVRRRHLPSLHARVLQGPAVPRFRRRHSRAARRAGHPPHGRAVEAPADHLLDVPDRLGRHCRRAAAGRVLLEGRDPVRDVRRTATRSCG